MADVPGLSRPPRRGFVRWTVARATGYPNNAASAGTLTAGCRPPGRSVAARELRDPDEALRLGANRGDSTAVVAEPRPISGNALSRLASPQSRSRLLGDRFPL